VVHQMEYISEGSYLIEVPKFSPCDIPPARNSYLLFMSAESAFAHDLTMFYKVWCVLGAVHGDKRIL
jgi:hypothetical protein